jgi:O-antigen ligase
MNAIFTGFSPSLVWATAGLGAFLLTSYRWRTLVLLLTILSFAVAPEYHWDFEIAGLGLGAVQKLLLIAAILMNAVRFGLRVFWNWPILALSAILLATFVFADLHRHLTASLIIKSFASMVLPWVFAHVVLQPGSRKVYTAALCLTAPVSILIGVLAGLQSPAGEFETFGDVIRLRGAGSPATLGVLGFAGVVFSLYEGIRAGRSQFFFLGAINLAILSLSGARMAILAACIVLLTYVALSPNARAMLVRHRTAVLQGAAVASAGLLIGIPSMFTRSTTQGSGLTTGRIEVWALYFQEFLLAPIFGRGIGAGHVAAVDWFANEAMRAPHNEYLHILVVGGVVGFVLFFGAVFCWARSVLRLLRKREDQLFFGALLLGLAIFAVTENILTMSNALVVYAYIAVMLTRSARTYSRRRGSSAKADQMRQKGLPKRHAATDGVSQNAV